MKLIATPTTKLLRDPILRFLLGIALVGLPIAPVGAELPPSGEVVRALVPAPSLVGNRLGTEATQNLLIYLPPTYAHSSAAFPVLYFLPGFTSPIDELVDGTYQGLVINESLDALMAKKCIPEMIVVVLDGQNELGGSFYVNSQLSGRWEDVVVEDMVGYIDENYRTIPDAGARGLGGLSMGGFGAIHIGFRHPDVFSYIYAANPGLFDDTGLEDLGIADNDDFVSFNVQLLGRINQLSVDERADELIRTAQQLYNSGDAVSYYRAFSLAYGAAFSPARSGAELIAYPIDFVRDEIVADEMLRDRYRNGFGSPSLWVREEAETVRKLRGIVLDYGTSDGNQWIPKGVRHLSAQLQSADIRHSVVVHSGGHTDRFWERFELHMLPYFGEKLSNEWPVKSETDRHNCASVMEKSLSY